MVSAKAGHGSRRVRPTWVVAGVLFVLLAGLIIFLAVTLRREAEISEREACCVLMRHIARARARAPGTFAIECPAGGRITAPRGRTPTCTVHGPRDRLEPSLAHDRQRWFIRLRNRLWPHLDPLASADPPRAP